MFTDGISKRILVGNTKFICVLVRDGNILASFCPDSHSLCVENISVSQRLELSSLIMLYVQLYL